MDKTQRAGMATRAFRLCRAALCGTVLMQAMHAANTFAAPSGANVVAGSGSVTNAGNTTTIRQTTSRLAIDWNAFGSRPNETITFAQPGANAIALNRVVGPYPSALLGRLDANGQVFIVNPNGVLFGPGAQVNVGGLLASSLDLSVGDFMSGRYAFAGTDSRWPRWHRHDLAGAVVNLGSVTSAPGGYVALIGTRAVNAGSIDAPGGFAALAAGTRVTVTLGDHAMIGLTVDQGALRALAANHGLIQADGGQAWLLASAEDGLLRSVVNDTGVVRARSAVNQNGVIRLVAEGGTARVSGTLDASAPAGGNGGAIDTSGAQVRIAPRANITTAAASGQTGVWRIASDTNNLIGASATDSATLARALGANNVTIDANAASVHIDSALAWNGANTLTLAANGIAIDAPIAAPAGTLALNTPGSATQGAPIDVAKLALSGGGIAHYTFTNASNRIGTLAANAGTLALVDAAPLSVASVASLTGVTSRGAITLTAPSITLVEPVTSRASGTAVTLAAPVFDNRAGAQGIVTPDGRWIVYSASPDADTFGGLQSGNLALWGDAWTGAPDARASASAGNRFAFDALQQITLTALNIDKPVDTPRTLGPGDVSLALRYNGANFGNAFTDSATTHEPFIFTVTSTGAAPGATSGSYTITITTADGPAGYQITTQSGTLRVSSAVTPVPPSPPVPPLPPSTPSNPDTTATLPAILDTVRTDATDPHLGDLLAPDSAPPSTPLVQTRTDSTRDGSRLPDDAWPGHVCRM